MSVIKWIHISDIHITSSGDQFNNYNCGILLEALWKDIGSRAQNIDGLLGSLDFAFITGDLAWSGGGEESDNEYDRVYSEIILPLMDHTGLSLERVFMVPGNHDVNRAAITTDVKNIALGLTEQDHISRLFRDSDHHEVDRAALFKRLEGYYDFVATRLPHMRVNQVTGL